MSARKKTKPTVARESTNATPADVEPVRADAEKRASGPCAGRKDFADRVATCKLQAGHEGGHKGNGMAWRDE